LSFSGILTTQADNLTRKTGLRGTGPKKKVECVKDWLECGFQLLFDSGINTGGCANPKAAPFIGVLIENLQDIVRGSNIHKSGKGPQISLLLCIEISKIKPHS
jgi:hypothetical protein